MTITRTALLALGSLVLASACSRDSGEAPALAPGAEQATHETELAASDLESTGRRAAENDLEPRRPADDDVSEGAPRPNAAQSRDAPDPPRPDPDEPQSAEENFDLRLALRLVAADGAPLARVPVSARFAAASGGAHGPAGARAGGLATDGEGRLEVVAPRWLAQLEEIAVLELTAAGLDPEGPPLGTADVELPSGRSSGLVDLGEVRLAPQPVIAAGRVVGASGDPISDASVVVEWAQTREDGSSLWRPDPGYAARSAHDGSFFIVGLAPERDLRLVASKSGHSRSAGVPFQPGMKDVTIVLETGGEIALRAVHSVPEALAGVEADLLDGDGELHSSVRLDSGGACRWTSLRPGSWTAKLRASSGGEPLAELMNLVVPAGGSCEDPRLDGFDLSESLIVRRVSIVDREGEDVPGATWVATEGEDVLGSGFARRALALVPVALGHAPTVTVRKDGYRPVTFSPLQGDATAVLTHTARVELVPTNAPGGLALEHLALRVGLLATSEDEGDRPVDPSALLPVVVREGARFFVEISTPGSYELAWREDRPGAADGETREGRARVQLPDVDGAVVEFSLAAGE